MLVMEVWEDKQNQAEGENWMRKMKTHEIWGYSCKCACIYEHMYTYMYKCIRYHIHIGICILTVQFCWVMGKKSPSPFFQHPHSMVPKKCGTSPLNHDPGDCFSWGWDCYGGCCRCWEDGINTIVLPSCDDDASWLSYVFKLVAQPVTSNWLDSQSTLTWPSSITISRPLL